MCVVWVNENEERELHTLSFLHTPDVKVQLRKSKVLTIAVHFVLEENYYKIFRCHKYFKDKIQTKP